MWQRDLLFLSCTEKSNSRFCIAQFKFRIGHPHLVQCGENSGGMATMPRGKLSESEESYRICTHSFLISTHNLPHFSSKSLFFICSSIFSFYFPHFSYNFPHFSSFFLRIGLTVLLTFHHFLYYFPHVSSELSSFLLITFITFPHIFPRFSSKVPFPLEF